MKKIKQPVLLWSVAGIILSLLTLITAVLGINSTPKVLMDSEVVIAAAGNTLDCVRSGDYAALEQLLYGTPKLGQLPEKSDDVQSRLMYMYLESIHYELADECRSSGEGVALDARIQCLDIASVSEALQAIVPELMQQVADELGDENAIYDKEHNYQDSFLNEVLGRAMDQVLSENPHTIERELTLQFARSDAGWQVVPDQTFVPLLSGFISE